MKEKDDLQKFQKLQKNPTYTMEEVADYFGVSERTIRRMIKAELIRAVRLRRQIRIPYSEIERLTALTDAETTNQESCPDLEASADDSCHMT